MNCNVMSKLVLKSEPNYILNKKFLAEMGRTYHSSCEEAFHFQTWRLNDLIPIPITSVVPKNE